MSQQTNPKLAKAAPRLMVTPGIDDNVHEENQSCLSAGCRSITMDGQEEAAEPRENGLDVDRQCFICGGWHSAMAGCKPLQPPSPPDDVCPVSPQRLRQIAKILHPGSTRFVPVHELYAASRDLDEHIAWLERGRV